MNMNTQKTSRISIDSMPWEYRKLCLVTHGDMDNAEDLLPGNIYHSMEKPE